MNNLSINHDAGRGHYPVADDLLHVFDFFQLYGDNLRARHLFDGGYCRFTFCTTGARTLMSFIKTSVGGLQSEDEDGTNDEYANGDDPNEGGYQANFQHLAQDHHFRKG